MVTRAAQSGDTASLAAFAELGDWLGWGMADLVSAWDPQCIIIGGGVAEAGDLMSIPARETYAKVTALRGRTEVAEVRIAALGNKAGLIGAADLARIR